MKKRRCFVTVGSTQFEKLVSAFFRADVQEALGQIGVDKVVIQNGSGEIADCLKPQVTTNDGEQFWEAEIRGIQFTLFRYRDSIRTEMENADLVVGHAGAGTCMEVLALHTPFIAVINNSLMDDHQSELAEQLALDGHLLCTVPEKLSDALMDPTLFRLTPFPKSDPKIFLQFMQNFLLQSGHG